MSNFFTLNYWLALRPGSLEPTAQKYFVFFIIILFVLIFISGILKSRRRDLYAKIWKSINSFSVTNFIIGLMLLFFTFELIPFLSSRFWFLLWLIGMIAWLYFIFKNIKKIPEIREKIAKDNEYKKYIP